MTKQELIALVEQVKAMSPAQRFLMASVLLEEGQAPEMAESIARSALDELTFTRLFPGRSLPK